jgi:hypothetical protein
MQTLEGAFIATLRAALPDAKPLLQKIVEPYIFHSFAFRSKSYLSRVADALSDTSRRSKVASWTRKLEFRDDDAGGYPTDKHLEAVITAHATRLVMLSITSTAAPNATLLAGVGAAAQSLQHLQLRIGALWLPALEFSCIGSLPNLHVLQLETTNYRLQDISADNVVPSAIPHTPWNIPNLTTLSICTYGCDSPFVGELLLFVSDCVFERLLDLNISVHTALLNENQLAAVGRFLRAHSGLTRCHLGAGSAALDVLLPCLASLLVDVYTIPSKDAITALHPGVEALKINATYLRQPALVDLIDSLSALAISGGLDAGLRKIQLNMSFRIKTIRGIDPEEVFFYWKPWDDWSAQSAAVMQYITDAFRALADQLLERGICLFDTDGYSQDGDLFDTDDDDTW